MPRWLDRLLPAIDIEGHAGLRMPAIEADTIPEAHRARALV